MNLQLILALPFLLLLAALAAYERKTSQERPPVIFSLKIIFVDICFFLLVFLYLLLSRWNSINFPFVLGTDEAQFTANALIGAYHFLSWHNSDGGSSGPVTSQILSMPAWFGFDITLASSRTIACLLIAATTLFIFKASVLICKSRLIALSTTLPLVYLYSRTASSDFLHYSSELAPNVLIAIALYCQLRFFSSWKIRDIFMSGICLGLIPYTKLQAAPIGAVVGAATILVILARPQKTFRDRQLPVITFSLACILPTLLYLVPLWATDNLHHFIKSYLVMASDYVLPPLSLSQTLSLGKDDEALARYAVCVSAIIFYGCLLAINGIRQASWRVLLLNNSISWLIFFYSLLLTATAVFVISKPGMPFPHYLNLLLPLIVILCASFFRVLHNCFYNIKFRPTIYFAPLLVIPGIMAVYPPNTLYFVSNITDREIRQVDLFSSFRSPRIFDVLLGEHPQSMLAWGWSPDWYMAANSLPATRYTTSVIHIADYPLKPYFNERLLEDLNKANPEILLDSMPLGSYTAADPVKNYLDGEQSPVKSFATANYTVITRHHSVGEVPVLYVRNDLVTRLNERFVRFAKIISSHTWDDPVTEHQLGPLNTDDNVVASSRDAWHWTLPDNSPGYIHFEFESPENITAINILNTGINYRATNEIDITLYNDRDESVSVLSGKLKAYPFWTTFDCIETNKCHAIKAARINIKSYFGNGAGLDEVKITRAKP